MAEKPLFSRYQPAPGDPLAAEHEAVSQFAEQAHATPALYDEAAADRLAFWAREANLLHWEQPFT